LGLTCWGKNKKYRTGTGTVIVDFDFVQVSPFFKEKDYVYKKIPFLP